MEIDSPYRLLYQTLEVGTELDLDGPLQKATMKQEENQSLVSGQPHKKTPHLQVRHTFSSPESTLQGSSNR